MLKVSVVMGTRPEIIKLAPLIKAFEKRSDDIECHVCFTGQHMEMAQPMLETFSIPVHVELNLMTENQTLEELSANAILSLGKVMEKEKPDWVVVQGDTTTAFIGALAAYYHKTPVAHVEAGLRTDNKYSPFPEEINRRLVDHLSDLLFPPTEKSRSNLLAEGIDESRIVVTGNTVVDALMMIKERIGESEIEVPGLAKSTLENGNFILVTCHRRESFGEPFQRICQGLAKIAEMYPEMNIVYPVHLNPSVRGPVLEILGSISNIHLIEPLSYIPFVYLCSNCRFVLTDSGGVQEEAPTFGKPVLVMREVTERTEGIEAGVARLVGSNTDAIVEGARELLENPATYEKMSRAVNPYGDGRASERILEALLQHPQGIK